MSRINASIITIGDELLIGQVVDTNSAWIAQQLNAIGIWVKRRVAVGDVKEEIWSALGEESEHSQVIIITGGLGPTKDDITKPVLCEYFEGKMVVNEEVLQHVQDIFTKYIKRPLLQSNLDQALVPDVCTVLQNRRGSAPGMWFEKDGRIYVAMPGVPMEMKVIMTDHVLPRLKDVLPLPVVVHRTLLTAGLGESFIAERIKDFESALPAHVKLAYLPNFALVKLRLTATGERLDEVSGTIDDLFVQLQRLVADVMVVNEDKKLEDAIGGMLQERGATLATAESCSGGYVAHLITSVAGSSKYFKGSVVAYDNSIKQNLLGVGEEVLEQHGAVSEETVIAMAEGVKQMMRTDYSLAVSGIMGPEGGSEEKPVGTVWICVSGKVETIARKFHVRYDREKNIEVTAIHALSMLRQAILSDAAVESVPV